MSTKKQTLEQRVLGFILEHRLVSGQETLLVAVSGGPDSVCLLHVLLQLQDKLDIKLHIAHLNHKLRELESEADASYVGDLAKQYGVPATIEERDVAGYKASRHLSLEEAAREVRYGFLAQAARKVGASRVAVGHTRDDHLETILMHIIRGTGVKGLVGLQPVTRLRLQGITVIRPLLTISRAETREYCRIQQLQPRTDSTNLLLRPMRNRVRLELLPLLKSYNPGVDEAILRLSRIAGDDMAFIEQEVDKVWDIVTRFEKGIILLDKRQLLELHPSLKRHVLRRCIEQLLGTLKDIEERHIDEVLAALTKPAGKRLSLPGGLTFAVEYDRYVLGADLARLNPFPPLEGVFNIKVPGETTISGWKVEASVTKYDMAEPIPDKDKNTACFDLEKTGSTIEVRTVRPGDRFQPFGMTNIKKVGEFMIDARIPVTWRHSIPIVCSPQQIIWVVGWRIDERVKVTGETKQVLCLKFTRQE